METPRNTRVQHYVFRPYMQKYFKGASMTPQKMLFNTSNGQSSVEA